MMCGITNLPKGFGVALGVNTLWVNVSEIFRYFVFVMPMMRQTFPNVSDIAPINASVFGLWMVWDTVLILLITGLTWLFMAQLGRRFQTAMYAGATVWCAVFVMFWLALFNMNLATWDMICIAWPLSGLEMLIAAWIVYRCYPKTKAD